MRSDSGISVASVASSTVSVMSSVIVGPQGRKSLVRPGVGCPAQRELAERFQLFEGQGRVAYSSSTEMKRATTMPGSLTPETSSRKLSDSVPRSNVTTDRRLLADADQRRVQMIEADVRDLLGRERQERECREVVDGQGPHELGRLFTVLLVEACRAHVPTVLTLQTAGEPRRDLLEGPVLQQAGEQQVARLEQRDGLGIHQFALREKPGPPSCRGASPRRRGNSDGLVSSSSFSS